MHSTKTGSASSKTDKPNSKDCSSAASPIPESQHTPMDNTWSDTYDPPPKSKGKSVKLKKNSKTENSKKIIREGSKDSVVLVGYKNLKVPYGDASTKYREAESPLNPEDERDNLQGASSGYLRTNADTIFDSGATSAHFGAVDSVVDDNITTAACQKGFPMISTNCDIESNPQAGTEAFGACNQPLKKDKQVYHSGQKLTPWSTGMKQIEVKPSNKDPYQGDKVTILLPCRTDSTPISNVPKITQRDICDSQQTVGDTVFERPSKEAGQGSSACLVSVKVKSDCIRLPDGAPCTSSRLSDSGIESEPSSFASQLVPGGQSCVGLGVLDSGVSQPERPLLNPAPRPVQQSSVQKPSGPTENIFYPENTSIVSGVQSSLTSINSLPSDDECEGSSRGSSGAEVRCRKSSVLVQEQSVIFSGDVTNKPARDLACTHDTAAGESQLPKPFYLEADPKAVGISDLGLEGASGSGDVKESCGDIQTACPSSNSATSSTDLVKRGMVENYFGSCSSTDVSEISPVETSAITLGIQAGAQVEDDEDETEHEMIENGYYEEGDGYAFVNGVPDGEQSGVGDAAAQEPSFLFEQLGFGYPHETKDLSKAPICSNLASGSVGHSSGRSPRPSALPSFSLRWYECAPTPQMKT